MAFDDRTRILLGDAGAETLASSRACVFGLGGVGAAAAMDLVRAGIGSIVVIDFDDVSESNLNRLYFGYSGDVGTPKVTAFARYATAVNPRIEIEAVGSIVRGAEAASMIPAGCGFYLDCIDTLNPKVNLMAALSERGLPFASAMGTAGRLAPERLKVGSLWDTRDCPLSALVRKRLRRLGRGSADFLCVWSDEPAVPPALPADGSVPGETVDGVRVRAVQGSGPFVPQAAGHILASLAVRSLLAAKPRST
ncbi:MAG: ThiF family adenylyltransferase [Spirochaetes bacterium]|nr:ThiF family adenylyltransferase [Spirochaetota bacterium]MBU1081401.1 ThiF family adenylyltransferase [Spirochaetota bacterium]